MSADAKAWTDDGWIWRGVNDLCDRQHEAANLADLLYELEECQNQGRRMRWEPFRYTDGTLGLRGWRA